nr:MAG TPA: hypothetical protein [Caudoviricetes sp.]
MNFIRKRSFQFLGFLRFYCRIVPAHCQFTIPTASASISCVFFEPVTLFLGPKRGSPSKIFTPRNILGLSNPHRGRRRGQYLSGRGGRAGSSAGRRQAGPPVPGRCRRCPGRAEGHSRPPERRRKGVGG